MVAAIAPFWAEALFGGWEGFKRDEPHGPPAGLGRYWDERLERGPDVACAGADGGLTLTFYYFR